MKINTTTIGALLLAIGVMLGAFGAHALKQVLSVIEIENWKTAVQYQFIHALAILITPLLLQHKLKQSRIISLIFMIGIICFSGSLYVLSCKNYLNISSSISAIGMITPLGGLLFIVGWLMLAYFVVKRS